MAIGDRWGILDGACPACGGDVRFEDVSSGCGYDRPSFVAKCLSCQKDLPREEFYVIERQRLNEGMPKNPHNVAKDFDPGTDPGIVADAMREAECDDDSVRLMSEWGMWLEAWGEQSFWVRRFPDKAQVSSVSWRSSGRGKKWYCWQLENLLADTPTRAALAWAEAAFGFTPEVGSLLRTAYGEILAVVRPESPETEDGMWRCYLIAQEVPDGECPREVRVSSRLLSSATSVNLTI